MIHRVDGTVIPESASECCNMQCVNNLHREFRVDGECLFDPDADYVHYNRMDCIYASKLVISNTEFEGYNYRGVNHEECAARDVLIRQHIANGGSLCELGVTGGYY